MGLIEMTEAMTERLQPPCYGSDDYFTADELAGMLADAARELEELLTEITDQDGLDVKEALHHLRGLCDFFGLITPDEHELNFGRVKDV